MATGRLLVVQLVRTRRQVGALVRALLILDYRAAVGLEPRIARDRRRLAERLWQSEQYFQAINEWRTLTEQLPTDIDTRLARGFEKINQPGGAYREYRGLLQIAPDQTHAGRAVARLEGRRR